MRPSEPDYGEMDHETPIIKGGQDRSADEVQQAAVAGVALTIGFFFAGLTIGAFIMELYTAAVVGAVLTVLVVVAAYLLMLAPCDTPETCDSLDTEG